MSGSSLRQQVFLYLKDHPYILNLGKEEQNTTLIEAFQAKDETVQATIKRYKHEYINEIEFAIFEEKYGDQYRKKIDPYFLPDRKKKKKVTKKIAKLQVKLEPWEKKVKCPHCPGLYANEIMKFVGFRGTMDRKGLCTLDIKGKEYQGEAWPPPIVPVRRANRDNLIRLTGKTREEIGSRFYLGILKYEVEYMTLIFMLRNIGYENIALLMARGMGKTYLFAWDDQLGLKHFNRNVMMLSETNARRKVGNWIYVWALRNKYLKDPEKFARKSTYQHFELLNNTRMDIYKFSDEDLVGEHDYILKLDDIVKRKWCEKPTENQKMIDHFQSNINYIIRSGLEICGTRKFEGDVLEHIIDTIEDLVLIKQSPFIECPHNNLNDDGTYDPCDICRDLCLLAPEIHSYDSLMAKMYEDFEKWYAEMMQNPHPMEGGMVDVNDIRYVKRPHWTKVKLISIGVDSTESDLNSSSMCGIVSCAMLKDTRIPEFVFLDADVRKMPFRTLKDHRGTVHRGILETISLMVQNYEINYPNIPIIIAIERQGGGIFIIKEARQNKLFWFKYIIAEKDKTRKGFHKTDKLGITHTKEKKARIFSELRYPIKEGQVRFAENLFGSMFVQQILTFPKGQYDDGPDSGGMSKDEALKRWYLSYEGGKPRGVREFEAKEQKAIEQHKLAGQPWLKDKQRALRRQKVRAYNRRVVRR